MIQYEVNLKISNDVLTDYMQWLNQHIQEMLTFSGFINATSLQEYNIDNTHFTHITVSYTLASKEHLEEYFKNHAEHMRAQGLEKFPGKFSATRRFFEVTYTY